VTVPVTGVLTLEPTAAATLKRPGAAARKVAVTVVGGVSVQEMKMVQRESSVEVPIEVDRSGARRRATPVLRNVTAARPLPLTSHVTFTVWPTTSGARERGAHEANARVCREQDNAQPILAGRPAGPFDSDVVGRAGAGREVEVNRT
jgi:hypothetical protein